MATSCWQSLQTSVSWDIEKSLKGNASLGFLTPKGHTEIHSGNPLIRSRLVNSSSKSCLVYQYGPVKVSSLEDIYCTCGYSFTFEGNSFLLFVSISLRPTVIVLISPTSTYHTPHSLVLHEECSTLALTAPCVVHHVRTTLQTCATLKWMKCSRRAWRASTYAHQFHSCRFD